MDFAVFPYIKSFLRGMRFNLSELRQVVMNVIFHQVEFSERYVLVHCGVSHGLNLMLVVVVSSVKLALILA
jgi:hypothetical protein